MHSEATHFPLRTALAAYHGFGYSVLSFFLRAKHSGVLLYLPAARASVMPLLPSPISEGFCLYSSVRMSEFCLSGHIGSETNTKADTDRHS